MSTGAAVPTLHAQDVIPHHRNVWLLLCIPACGSAAGGFPPPICACLFECRLAEPRVSVSMPGIRKRPAPAGQLSGMYLPRYKRYVWGYQRADVVAYNYHARGSTSTSMSPSPPKTRRRRSRAARPTRPAPRRARKAVKDTKYKPLAAARGGTFKPAVIERGGAFGDSLVSAIKIDAHGRWRPRPAASR